MKVVYPAVFMPDGKWFVVSVPDFDICTQGEGLAEAIAMARDAICLAGITWQDKGMKLPAPSDAGAVPTEPGEFVTLIDCDLDSYRKSLENRAVKKNCTLPAWLNQKAESAHINFSAVLQEALMEKLNLKNT